MKVILINRNILYKLVQTTRFCNNLHLVHHNKKNGKPVLGSNGSKQVSQNQLRLHYA